MQQTLEQKRKAQPHIPSKDGFHPLQGVGRRIGQSRLERMPESSKGDRGDCIFVCHGARLDLMHLELCSRDTLRGRLTAERRWARRPLWTFQW